MSKLSLFLFKFSVVVLCIASGCAPSPSVNSNQPLFPIWQKGKMGYISSQGKVVIPPKFGVAREFKDGLAAVCEFGKWGFINRSGNVTIPCRFSQALNFSEGYALVQESPNGGWSVLGKNGDLVSIPRGSPYLDSNRSKYCGFHDGHARLKVTPESGIDYVVFIDTSGRDSIPGLDGIELRYVGLFSEGLSALSISIFERNDLRGGPQKHVLHYINTKGERVFTVPDGVGSEFSEGLAAVTVYREDSKEGVVGYVNSLGVFVIPPKFKSGSSFREGLASVTMVNGNCGYIDKDGKSPFEIDRPVSYCSDFSEGLASVHFDGKHGFIGHKGTWVIPPRFEEISKFREGLALASSWEGNDRVFGYVDIKGKYVWSMHSKEIEGIKQYLNNITPSQGVGFFMSDFGNAIYMLTI